MRQYVLNARLFAIVVLALIALARLVAVIDGRDPGYDQLMLLANFPLPDLASYTRPLPFFEQGTGLFSVMENDLAARLFGPVGMNRVHAIRVLAMGVALAGFLLYWRVLRSHVSIGAAALTVALMASTNEALLFHTNPKNYANAFFAACLLLWCAQNWLNRPDLTRSLQLVGASILTCLFAFTAPLIIVTIGGGMLAHILANRDGNELSQSARVGRLSLLAIAALTIAYLFHVFFTVPVTAHDQAAYANRYLTTFIDIRAPYSEQTIGAVERILAVYWLMIEPVYFPQFLHRVGLISYLGMIHIVTAVIAVIGLPAYFRASPILAGGLIVGSLTFAVLNALHVLPIASVRHFLFFTPFAVPSFALGVLVILKAGLRPLRPGQNAEWVGIAIAIVLLCLSVIRAGDLQRNNLVRYFALIDEIPAKTWVYYGAQPGLRALRPDLMSRPDIPLLGLLNHESTNISWQLQARDDKNFRTRQDYVDDAAQLLTGSDPIWLVFANHWPERLEPEALGRYIGPAEAGGRVCYGEDNRLGALYFCAGTEDYPERLKDLWR